MEKKTKVETFGKIIDAKYLNYIDYGFVYKIELAVPNSPRPLVYIGSKLIDSKDKWRTYTGTSDLVDALLAKGFKPSYSILGYYHRSILKRMEEDEIKNQWKLDRDNQCSLNKSLSTMKLLRTDFKSFSRV